jgi:hypothetical protein
LGTLLTPATNMENLKEILSLMFAHGVVNLLIKELNKEDITLQKTNDLLERYG